MIYFILNKYPKSVKYCKKRGIVYLLGDSLNEGVFKIGVTRKKIEDRIKKLQTGNAGEIYLVDYYETDTPFFLERDLHKRYNYKKENGEWFNLSLDEMKNFKKRCQEIEEMIKALKDNPFFPKDIK